MEGWLEVSPMIATDELNGSFSCLEFMEEKRIETMNRFADR
jgi:hypothetical protein